MFYVEDLTVNDGDLKADASDKKFDIKLGCNWAKVRSIKIVQLKAGSMYLTFEVWEKDANGYNPSSRSTFHMRVLRRTIHQEVEDGAEFHEILSPELVYHDRDKTGELHCRILNQPGGTDSDFAVVVKCAEMGEAI